MERFVRLLVVGGLVLVAGLWIERWFEPMSSPWLVGILLALVGFASLAAGIALELDVG